MNKKSLIALAVASAFAAPVAMAEVTLSGAIAVGVDIAKSSSSTDGDPSLTSQTLSVGYTNFGIASSDDIGNGNRVEVYLQFIDDISGAGSGIVNRNSYIGLAGDWGALRLGTNENAYERMLYSHNYLDGAWGPSNISIMGHGPSGGIGAAGSVWERTSETIMYYSPNFNGFSFEVDYALPGGGKTQTESPSLLSIAAEYKPENMPWRGYVGYQKSSDRFYLDTISGESRNAVTPAIPSGATGSDETYMLIGGGVTFGDLMVDLIYEMAEWEQTGSALTKLKRNAFDIEAKYTLPTGHIGVSFVVAEDPEATEAGVTEKFDGGAKSLAIGYWHTLSKQSSLFGIYGRVDNDREADYRAGGFTPAAGEGRDHQNFIVGIKHVF